MLDFLLFVQLYDTINIYEKYAYMEMDILDIQKAK